MRATKEVMAGPSSVKSIIDVFSARVAKAGASTAARHKVAGAWVDVAWSELDARRRRVAAGLIGLDVQPGDRVAIIGATRIDWMVADLGVGSAGATSVPIYHSNLPDEVQFIADNAGVVVAFADGKSQVAKFKQVRARLPNLRKVITLDGAPGDGDWVMSLADLEKQGEARLATNAGEVEARIAATASDDVATILYTSGTTGVPKGVMLTHDAFVFGGESIESRAVIATDDSVLLFLPLAHSFAQLIKAAWFRLGYPIAFCESPDSLLAYVAESRPSVLPSVPRIFEKIYNKVVSDGMSKPGIAGALFRMAMGEFENYAKAMEKGQAYSSLPFTLAKKLVFPKIHAALLEKLGGRMRVFISGGAPLSRKIALFFQICGFVICEGYGLTETTAVTSINPPPPGKIKIGTVGPAFPGIDVRIATDGEILLRGRCIMKGYYKLPEATAEAIDAEGWFHTGDIGEVDTEGYIRITDRKKDLLKTSNGKYIAPSALENALKANPLISQVVIHGDNRKFVSALVTVAEDTAKKIAKDKNVTYADYAELTTKPEIRAAVQEAMDRLNATLPSYEAVKKFAILPKDFTQESGELTPTLKVKRKVCNERYKTVLDGFYAGDVV